FCRSSGSILNQASVVVRKQPQALVFVHVTSRLSVGFKICSLWLADQNLIRLCQLEAPTQIVMLMPADVALALHSPNYDARRDPELGGQIDDLVPCFDFFQTEGFGGRN